MEARVRLQKYFARHKHKNGEIEHCEQFKHEICYEVSTRSLEIRFAGTWNENKTFLASAGLHGVRRTCSTRIYLRKHY